MSERRSTRVRRPPAAWSLVVLAAVAGLWPPGRDVTRAQTPTFRATSELVRVDVSVRERNRPVTGLRAADFDLVDNGVLQDVVDVVYEQVPIDVTVCLDVSHSVDGPLLLHLRQSVRDLRRDLRPQDRLKLVSFNQRVRRQVDFAADRGQVESALGALAASGSTSVFDALAVALVAHADPDRRQLVMVFTDASDTSSITHSSALVEIARLTNAALGFVVGGGSATRRVVPHPILTRLAGETGGLVLPVLVGESLSATFRRILDEFRTSYILHFRPTGVERIGFHQLEVRVKRPGTYEVRARRGYQGG